MIQKFSFIQCSGEFWGLRDVKTNRNGCESCVVFKDYAVPKRCPFKVNIGENVVR